jgi:hypothetical protein
MMVAARSYYGQIPGAAEPVFAFDAVDMTFPGADIAPGQPRLQHPGPAPQFATLI